MIDNMVVDYASRHLGNYRLIHLLGRGGFASVYLGEHRYLERPAAIKVLRATLSEHDKVSFLTEAKLLANLSHPHIVRVLEFAVAQRQVVVQAEQVTANIPFLVMDYAPGGNLRRAYPSGSVLFLHTAVQYIKQIASGLQYAHAQGIIHRDIKPENLLLNERQEVMLSDFGLALLAPSPDLLSVQEMAGTLPYTAPEQLQGKPCFASDQYSLGIIVYEWLCGQRPFGGKDVEIIMHHLVSPLPSLRTKNSSIPQSVEDVVLKALAKDPQQRYPSVEEFALALEEASQMSRSDLSRDTRNLVRVLPQPGSAISPAHVTSQRASEGEKRQIITVSSRSARKNRLRMMQKVRSFWITGVLEHSLSEMPFITPELREMQSMVASTWHLQLPATEHQAGRYAPGTSIADIYDSAAGELLLLGAAGAGKTTLLLKLASDLLNRAAQDETHPIPVVFTLSTWTQKQMTFVQWLIEELNSKYQVPRSLGEYWVHNEMILPLLDGLDEVAEASYPACIAAINTYRMEYGLSSLVVAGRLNEYLSRPSRLLLRSAVSIQPLMMEQVESYFTDTEGSLKAVYQVLCRDPEVRKLVTTPLVLSIVLLAYQGKSAEELYSMHDSGEYYQVIFSTYIEQMLSRGHTRAAFTPQQSVQWLSNLAQQMQQHNQTIFYLELIQGSYIGTARLKQVYTWLAVLLPGMFLGMFVGILSNNLFFHIGNVDSIFIDGIFGLLMGYLFSNMRVDRSYTQERVQTEPTQAKPRIIRKGHLIEGFLLCLIACIFLMLFRGVMYGLIGGIIVGGVSFLLNLFLQSRANTRSADTPTHHATRKKSKGFHLPLDHIKNGIVVGVAYGTSLKLQLIPGNNLSYLLGLAVRDSIRNGMLAVLLSILMVNNDGVVRLSAIISWSWRKFFASLRSPATIMNGMFIGCIIAVSYGAKQVVQGNLNDVLSSGLSSGAVLAVGYYLVHTTLSSISSSKLDDSQRAHANEGIQRSLRYAIVGSITGALVTSFAYIVNNMLYFAISTLLVASRRAHFENIPMGSPSDVLWHGALLGFHTSLPYVLLFGILGGLLAGGLLGGLTCLQHGVLRVILWRMQTIPLRAVQFLDYAARTILLYKVGGGYIFIHRLLLEYFAALTEVGSKEKIE